MTPEQMKQFKTLSDEVAAVALKDADPKGWTDYDAGVPLCDLSTEQRGDAVWCRRVALSTLTVLIKIETLLQHAEVPDSADDVEAEAKEAKREAKKLLASIQKRAYEGTTMKVRWRKKADA